MATTAGTFEWWVENSMVLLDEADKFNAWRDEAKKTLLSRPTSWTTCISCAPPHEAVCLCFTEPDGIGSVCSSTAAVAV